MFVFQANRTSDYSFLESMSPCLRPKIMRKWKAGRTNAVSCILLLFFMGRMKWAFQLSLIKEQTDVGWFLDLPCSIARGVNREQSVVERCATFTELCSPIRQPQTICLSITNLSCKHLPFPLLTKAMAKLWPHLWACPCYVNVTKNNSHTAFRREIVTNTKSKLDSKL